MIWWSGWCITWPHISDSPHLRLVRTACGWITTTCFSRQNSGGRTLQNLLVKPATSGSQSTFRLLESYGFLCRWHQFIACWRMIQFISGSVLRWSLLTHLSVLRNARWQVGQQRLSCHFNRYTWGILWQGKWHNCREWLSENTAYVSTPLWTKRW